MNDNKACSFDVRIYIFDTTLESKFPNNFRFTCFVFLKPRAFSTLFCVLNGVCKISDFPHVLRGSQL